MKKILLPTNPNDSIMLPPFVDFRDIRDRGEIQKAYNQIRDYLIEKSPDLIEQYATQQGKQEGQE